MSDVIIRSSGFVTLLGGGDPRAEDIEDAFTRAPCLVAADGAARIALSHGLSPAAVIGDLDSLDAETRSAIDPARIHNIPEQQSTDFEKCLARISSPLVLATGFTSRRIDHALAVYSVLSRFADSPCLLIGTHDLVFAAQTKVRLNLPIGSRLSLFPLRNNRGRSTGLEWPIDAVRFDPIGEIGTSNIVTGPVHLEFDHPGMLVILPKFAINAAIQALAPNKARVLGPECKAQLPQLL